MFFTKTAIEFLTHMLMLLYQGIKQNWDIEMADSIRIAEFIHLYNTESLSIEQNQALISLTIASYDELLTAGINENAIWQEIVFILRSKKELFKDIIEYWSLPKETVVISLR